MAQKVIWADDNESFRQTQVAVLEYFCSRAGIVAEFDEASDGAELVQKVIGSDYALIFTDNQMTQVHGLQAIAQIREHNKTVPICMVSSSDVGQRAMELGATGYVDKNDSAAFKSGIEAVIKTYLK